MPCAASFCHQNRWDAIRRAFIQTADSVPRNPKEILLGPGGQKRGSPEKHCTKEVKWSRTFGLKWAVGLDASYTKSICWESLQGEGKKKRHHSFVLFLHFFLHFLNKIPTCFFPHVPSHVLEDKCSVEK